MSQRCILIGHPVSHSVSPAIHGEAYRRLGIDAVYELRDAPTRADVLRLVEEVRSGGVRGANVTVPWKQVALEAADVVDPSARDIGAANVLCRGESGRVVAYNTDALGLCDELLRLKRQASDMLSGREAALVVGSGGAAFASVAACRCAGFGPIRVTARRFDPGAPRDTWPGGAQLAALGAQLVAWPGFGRGELLALSTDTAVIVQATSAGMKGKGGGEELSQLLALDQFSPSIAYDLVYNPKWTPFCEAAKRAGHVADSGLGMLVGQAAHAIEIWFGVLPEQEPLLAAARGALGL